MSLADVANSWLAAHNDDLVGWRRHIHRYPELGRQEYKNFLFQVSRQWLDMLDSHDDAKERQALIAIVDRADQEE